GPVAAAAGRRAAPADVRDRRDQRAAGDAVVGGVAGGRALAVARAPAACRLRGLAARHRDAVPGAGALHVRVPADGVPALDGATGVDALALRPGRRRPVRRAAAYARGGA